MVIFKEGYWTLWKTTNGSGVTSLSITNDDNACVLLVLEVDKQNSKWNNIKYNNIAVRLLPSRFADPGYFRDFMKECEEADTFIQRVYEWCVENGYWLL